MFMFLDRLGVAKNQGGDGIFHSILAKHLIWIGNYSKTFGVFF